MWYQRLSVRSMPAASVLSVGTTQAAASAPTASTATIAATFHTGGRGGASEGAGARPASSLDETTPAPMPTTIVAASTVNSWNQPKVPRISLIHDQGGDPQDDLREAGRRSGPAGQQQDARAVRAEGERGDHREELDHPDQVVAGGEDALARGRGDEGQRRAHASCRPRAG